MDRLLFLSRWLSHPLSILSGGILICLLSVWFHLSRERALSDLHERAKFLREKKLSLQHKEETEKRILAQMEAANPVYVEEVLAKLCFLQNETDRLQVILRSEPSSRKVKERLEFIQGSQNQLRLREENFQRVSNLEEVDVIQDHPIELSQNDLTYLLSQLENVALGSYSPEHDPPYFVIKSFDLSKKSHSSEEETFVVNVKMTKLELVHE